FNCEPSGASRPPSCSGTLIGNHTFLMAAHCVSDGLDVSHGEHCRYKGEGTGPSNVNMYKTNLGGNDEDPQFEDLRVVVSPAYADHADHDLAVVSFAGSADGITPIPVARAKPTPGTAVTMVGYGVSDPSTIEFGGGAGVRYFGDSTILSVAQFSFETP